MAAFPEIHIAGRAVGHDHAPFVVAEMSGNHNGSLERALRIVEMAARAGAHALKLQTYTADTMTLPLREGRFLVRDPKSPWVGRTLHDLYAEAHTPWEWHPAIFARCRELGLVAFSTPFDASAVEFLESLGAPAYKIASLENVDLPLVRRVARTGKPVIISTGLATAGELEEVVEAAREAGAKDLVLLKCTSTYPAPPEEANLRTIPHLEAMFGTPVGLSDHTLGIGAAIAAVALGACLIEKHVTLDRAEGGVDALFSLEPAELRALVEETERAFRSLGSVAYGPSAAEEPTLAYRRSLYVVRPMRAGERFDRSNLRAIRPGGGLPPKHAEAILGRRITRDASPGTPLSWDLVAEERQETDEP